MEKLSRELLGLTGEYAVASELCKRGVYAQLTLGHHKRTDIIIETDFRMIRIDVKAKQGNEWPGLSGIFRDDDFLILVDLSGKRAEDRPDFYVLNKDNWERLVDLEKQRKPEIEVNKKLEVRYPDGWKGLNIKVSMVLDWKEDWKKLLDMAMTSC